jgi:hypothetical protein
VDIKGVPDDWEFSHWEIHIKDYAVDSEDEACSCSNVALAFRSH